MKSRKPRILRRDGPSGNYSSIGFTTLTLFKYWFHLVIFLKQGVISVRSVQRFLRPELRYSKLSLNILSTKPADWSGQSSRAMSNSRSCSSAPSTADRRLPLLRRGAFKARVGAWRSGARRGR